MHLSTIFEGASVKPLRSRKTNANAIFHFRALKPTPLAFQTFKDDSKTIPRRLSGGEKRIQRSVE